MRKPILIGAGVAVVAAGTGTFLWMNHGDASAQYRTTVASVGTVTQTVSLSGNLSPVGETDLNFASSGRVAAVDTQVGEQVTPGQVMATLDTTALQSGVTIAQANLASAQARLSLDESGATAQALASAQAQVSSAQVTLLNDGTAYNDTVAVNQQQYAGDGCNANPQPAVCAADAARERQSNDQAAGQVSMARVQLQNAQAALRSLQEGSTPQQIQMDQSQVQIDEVNLSSAQTAVSEATLTAPVAGVVAALNVTSGQEVGGSSQSSGASSASSSSSPAVAIITPGAFAVTGSVSDALVHEITVGQKAQVLVAGSTEAETGSVTAVAQQATVSSGVATFSVTVTLDGADPALRDGMSASVNVIVNQVVEVLTVPTSAVRTSGGSSTVQVLVNGKAQTRSVQIGASDALRTQIVSGINRGDQVIIATISANVPASSGGAGGLFGGGFGGGRGGGARAFAGG